MQHLWTMKSPPPPSTPTLHHHHQLRARKVVAMNILSPPSSPVPVANRKRLSGLQLQFGMDYSTPVTSPQMDNGGEWSTPIEQRAQALAEVRRLQEQFRELARSQNASLLAAPEPTVPEEPASEYSDPEASVGTSAFEDSMDDTDVSGYRDSFLMMQAEDLQRVVREARRSSGGPPVPETVGEATKQVAVALKALLAVLLVQGAKGERALRFGLSMAIACVLALILR